ncbi:MAG: UDP-glucose/GDP-mannose dehydrogenase family protein [Actinomycetota bacterium]
MRIAVIGTGHVGLVTCVSMAAVGHDVVGTDADPEKIQLLQQARAPFFEPGLEDLLRSGLGNGRLRFTPETAEAVAGADVVFICVGTPPRESGEANLVAVEQAARAVARGLTGPAVVVEKSTVPAGTSTRLARALTRERPDLADRIEVASNPEFLREGKAVEDALHPDRILIGATAERAFEVLREVYRPMVDAGAPLIETDIQTAELAKHACNAFLALKISYANALARLCERSGADVVAVADVMGADARIGRDYLNAGLGYGGYCFPKDLQAFERLARTLHYDFPLLREIARINHEAVVAAYDKVTDAVWNIEGKTITLLGLAFKPQTDDVRLSPALVLARKLLEAGATVIGYDPEAAPNAKADLPDLDIAPDPYEAAAGAHCIVLCTEWDEFRLLDLERLKAAMAHPVLVDGRNLLDPEVMVGAGFTYIPMGRPSS